MKMKVKKKLKMQYFFEDEWIDINEEAWEL